MITFITIILISKDKFSALELSTLHEKEPDLSVRVNISVNSGKHPKKDSFVYSSHVYLFASRVNQIHDSLSYCHANQICAYLPIAH